MLGINWTPIVENYTNETEDFVTGNLSLRQFIQSVDGDARHELYRAEKQYGTNKSRQLARRALNRRNIFVTS